MIPYKSYLIYVYSISTTVYAEILSEYQNLNMNAWNGHRLRWLEFIEISGTMAGMLVLRLPHLSPLTHLHPFPTSPHFSPFIYRTVHHLSPWSLLMNTTVSSRFIYLFCVAQPLSIGFWSILLCIMFRIQVLLCVSIARCPSWMLFPPTCWSLFDTCVHPVTHRVAHSRLWNNDSKAYKAFVQIIIKHINIWRGNIFIGVCCLNRLYLLCNTSM